MCQKDRGDDIFQCDELNKQLQGRQLPGTFVGINHFDRIWWQPARINHIPVVFVFSRYFVHSSFTADRRSNPKWFWSCPKVSSSVRWPFLQRPFWCLPATEGQQENLGGDLSWATRKSYSSGITMVGVGIEIRPSMICFLLLKVTLM